MNRLAPLALAFVLAACGANDSPPAGPPPGPYSQDATAECLEEAGYGVEIGHGDPPSMRAEDIVFHIWFPDLGETGIDLYHPSAEVPDDGERYDNAVLVFDEAISAKDRDAIVACLR